MTDQADTALEEEEAAAAGDDGEENPDGAEGEASGRKFGKKKIILIVAIALVVLIGVGAGVYFSGLLGGGEEQEKQAAAEGGESDQVPPVAAHYLDLDEMVITLGGIGRKSSFLKMRLSLELANPEDEIRIKAIMPRIIDNFQVFLRELRIEELQGSQGLYRVKEELLTRVNSASHPTKVRDVLFREMLVQ